MFLSRLLAGIVEHSRRRAPLVVLLGLLLAGLCGFGASGHLGVSTDTDLLFSAELDWRKREIAFNAAFPQFHDLLVAVVDAEVPEEAEQTAAELASALRADTQHFAGVSQPDTSPFLEANGFLFLETAALRQLMDNTIDAQPFLGQLVADPSARGLFAALTLVGMGVERGQADLGPFTPALAGFAAALGDAAAGRPRPLSWERLLGGTLADLAGPYRFVLAKPKLDYGALQPGGAATDALRAAAARLEFVRGGQAHVRVTGSVALGDEEFATVAQGALVGTLASVGLIVLWLVLAVRSWRLIVPIVSTLVVGLLATTGFATLAVGTLNLISVAFAILFVGIAVDFAIQFSVRYRELRLGAPDHAAALAATAHQVGPQILVAAAATAAGFLAFVPTSFSGVAELGLIAGAGMVIAFLSTVVFLPAALTLCRPRPERGEVGFALLDGVEAGLRRARWPVLGLFGALALAGVVLLPRLSFDSDPLHTKDPTTESMRTLAALLEQPLSNPYTIDLLEPDRDAADALAARLSKLPLAAEVITLSSFVPQDQAAKLAVLADAASVLGPTLSPRQPAAPVTAADIRLAARTAQAQLARVRGRLPAGSPLLAIDDALAALAEAPDARLLAADAALTRFLPAQLARLRRGLDAKPVQLADIPADLRRDWQLPDGRTRVEVLPRPAAHGSQGLHAFVAEVATITPDGGGSAAGIVATAATIIGAFRDAAMGAIVAIALILSAVLRRARDVALVMAPLLLSALMTAVAAVLLPLPLNFANIIAAPLLLGVGVSFNIYFVMNWRNGATRFLGTATARAILFSALTTGTAFGALAASVHPGTASMGRLLLLSLACTLLASLVFVPTLLGVVRRRTF